MYVLTFDKNPVWGFHVCYWQSKYIRALFIFATVVENEIEASGFALNPCVFIDFVFSCVGHI